MKACFRVLFILLFLQVNSSFAQDTDSCYLRISILTCAPGTELYSTFGHTALRVIHKKEGTDIVYNYGTFDFNDPDFYTKFVRGKLLYFLNTEGINDFMYGYELEQRNVQEQVLQLSCTEKENIIAALRENMKKENRFYKYDFTYDNCTTRIRDLIEKNSKTPVFVKNILPTSPKTFRNLIHEYLNANQQNWSKLGIDILLGSPLDKQVNTHTAQFLPDYYLKGLDSATVANNPLIASKKTILPLPSPKIEIPFFTPFVVFSLVTLLIILLSFINNAYTKKVLAIIDFTWLFLLGALGVLLIFMWTGTDHQTCKNNYNLLWAFPLHLVMAFMMYRKTKSVKKYFQFTIIVSALTMLCWFFLPQQMNIGLLPIVLLVLVRSYFIQKNNPA